MEDILDERLAQMRIFLGSVMTIAMVVGSMGLASERALADGVRLPEASGAGCEAAIEGVKTDLARRGLFIKWKNFRGKTVYPRVERDGDFIGKYYYDAPADRSERVKFSLTGNAPGLHKGLFASPVLMAKLGSQVMADCPSVGMVSFYDGWESNVPVGYFPDGTVKRFQWVEMDPENPHQRWNRNAEGSKVLYEWGFYYTP
jgi:hypothetical protein